MSGRTTITTTITGRAPIMTLLPSAATGLALLSISLLSGRLASGDLAQRPVPVPITAAAGSLAADGLGEPPWRRYLIAGPAQILPRPPVRDRT